MQCLYYLKYKTVVQLKAQTAAVLMSLYALVFASIYFAKCLFKSPYWKIDRAWSSSKEINKSSKHVDCAPIRCKAQKLPPKNSQKKLCKKFSHIKLNIKHFHVTSLPLSHSQSTWIWCDPIRAIPGVPLHPSRTTSGNIRGVGKKMK